MKMGTCEQPKQPEHEEQVQRDGLNMEENNVTITGPPASRTVIDNLKKLLLQRQHSRESDTENNRNIAIRSDQGSNSDAAFYSQFSTSSSDSDSSDYMIFQEISNQDGCTNGEGRRKHRRRRSYSSSSSSSSSPVARCRRKVTRVNVTLASNIADVGGEASTPQKSSLDEQVRSNEYNDSANSTSSHKDSSSEDNFPGGANQNSKSLSSSEEVAPNRCAKLKSRRDRDRKRKRYGKNYTSHRSKLLKVAEKTTITSSSPSDGSSQLQADENKTQVSLTCATTSARSNVETVSTPVIPSATTEENKESNEHMNSSTAPNVSASPSTTENPVSHSTDK